MIGRADRKSSSPPGPEDLGHTAVRANGNGRCEHPPYTATKLDNVARSNVQ